MTVEFAWRAASAPYLGTAAALAGLGLYAAIVRGDKTMRLALVAAVACGLPWSLGYALAAGVDDPAMATRILRVGGGAVALAGPAILLLLLGGAGLVERYRRLLAVATALAVGSTLLAWSTPWAVAGARPLGAGVWYPEAGPLLLPHVAQVLGWSACGLVLGRRAVGEGRARIRPIHAVAFAAIVGVAIHDARLAHGGGEGLPLAWAAALIAVASAAWKIGAEDLLRGRGVDRGVAIEVALLAAGGAAAATAVVGLREQWPAVLVAAAAATGPVIAAGVAMVVRGRPRPTAAPPALGEQPALALPDLAARVATAWQAVAPVEEVRLWVAVDETLRTATGKSIDAGPPAGRAALVRWADVIAPGDLAVARLGAHRAALTRLVAQLGPDVVVPLTQGERLLGAIGARRIGEQAIRGREREALADVGRAAARDLLYLARSRAAEAAADAAREVELAQALRAGATVEPVEVAGWHVALRGPAGGVAVAWHPLGGRRLALLFVDAGERGVASGLLTAAMVGAFAAASQLPATSNAAVSLAKALHRTLLELAPARRAGAFVAILDEGRIEWANAGHRGAMLVSPGGRALRIAGDSAALGGGGELATGAAPLAPDQVVLAVSDAAIAVTDARGRRWGEARLGEVLARHEADGDLAAEVEAAIAAHAAGPLGEDVLVVAVRPALLGDQA